MESRIMPAAAFNRIPTLEEQSARISHEDLKSIGSIYVRNGVEDYDAGLLHRHYDLPENHIMIHTPAKGNRDICKPHLLHDLHNIRISPHSLCLNDDFNFRPFEHDIDMQRTPLATTFLCELKDFLIENGLEQLIAIVPKTIHKSSDIALEVLEPEKSAMWSSSTSIDQATSYADGVATSWSFARDENGRLEIRETKKCIKLPTGLHVRVKETLTSTEIVESD